MKEICKIKCTDATFDGGHLAAVGASVVKKPYASEALLAEIKRLLRS